MLWISKPNGSHEAAMNTQAYNQRTTRSIRVAAAAAFAALIAMPLGANAQSDPTGSDAQKPYIMIMMDTSGSMEWTDEGDEEYPSDGSGSEWQSGNDLFPDDESAHGSCYIWDPECGSYERPAWTPEQGQDAWTDAYRSGQMSARLNSMKSPDSLRLTDASQPRHVTLKEILTGDMVMYNSENTDLSIDDLSAIDDGPGCWFVPRQYDASSQSDRVCADDLDEFDNFPDYTEPKPHFQEVFDGQRSNGLMDTVAGNAIFSVAMFDGYKQSHNAPEQGWDGGNGNQNLDDSMDPGGNGNFAGIIEGEGRLSENASNPRQYNYNLGLYQVLGPNDLDISTSLAGQISNFVQYALVDAGYLRDDDDKSIRPQDGDDGGWFDHLLGLDLSFGEELEGFVDEYILGRQPIARATPLAAAVYDIHQYFAHGKEGQTGDKSPIIEDPYMSCRPKHVIMMTDGYPEPEQSGGVQVGGETLNAAFGYEEDRYPYSWTEDAIERFVHDQEYDNGSPRGGETYLADSNWSSDKALRFNPRVHIVGLQVGDPTDTEDDTLERQAIHKLAEMAIAGKTCAGQYLDDLKPESYCEDGQDCCDLDEEGVCLDARQAEYMADRAPYHYPTADDTDPQCDFPALILTSNDRDAMADVFQRLFNSILSGGVASRTRPTFVNRLDEPTITNPDPDDFGTPQGGQYRMFSGVEIDGDNPFWRGLLFRETLLCTKDEDGDFAGVEDGVENGYVALHDQIEALAGEVILEDDEENEEGDVVGDQRRIFTSFANEDAFNYETNRARSLDSASGFDRFRFLFGMDLETTSSGNDEFGGTYLGAAPEALLDGRVPFEIERMREALSNLDISTAIEDYFHVRDTGSLVGLVDEVRGRAELKEERALGAILNSSPVAVEPPDLDLPIDSYRAFKATHGHRPSMLYFATTDGLLHAVHAGELGDEAESSKANQVSVRGATSPGSAGGASNESDGSMHDQREAWAYLPQILHNDLSLFEGKQPYLLDGTPVVKDVRLCHKNESFNQNKQACRHNCTSDDCRALAENEQWRTVLVAGLGEAGSGYFALDVTRPGGVHHVDDSGIQVPDPVPLWEFDSNWERGQVEVLADQDEDLVFPADSELDGMDEDFWSMPFMGKSVGEAAIGTIAVNAQFNDQDPNRLRRPVAVFTAGDTGAYGPQENREERVGRAIYVVDMQTGTLLRRFVSYNDDDGEHRFEHPVVGSPALYNSFPGSLTTRGFVGDKHGRLFRIDFSSDDPSEWGVQLFFDPADSDEIVDASRFGPASYKPALSLGTGATENDLLIFYGLGERGDLSSSGQTQLMIGLREEIDVDFGQDNTDAGEATVDAGYLWHVEFEEPDYDSNDEPTGGNTEKLTGAPVVFNQAVYFTTYVEPAADRCEPGWSRIYGMKYEGQIDTSSGAPVPAEKPEGAIVSAPSSTVTGNGSNAQEGDEENWYYEPANTNDLQEAMIVRGLTVTLGPVCSADPASTGGMQGGGDRKPTLVAQTSSPGAMGGDTVDAPGDNAALTSIEHELPEPTSQNIPLSWAVINQ